MHLALAACFAIKPNAMTAPFPDFLFFPFTRRPTHHILCFELAGQLLTFSGVTIMTLYDLKLQLRDQFQKLFFHDGFP